MTDIKINIDFCKTNLISDKTISINQIIIDSDRSKYNDINVTDGTLSFLNDSNEVIFRTYIEDGSNSLLYFLERMKEALSLYRHNYRDLDIDTILDMFKIKYIEILL